MHVAMVFPYSARELTGIGVVVKTISRAIIERGGKVAWLAPRGSGPLLVSPQPSVTLHELPAALLPRGRDVILALGTFLGLLRIPGLTHVHAHSPHLQAIAALFASKIRNIPFIITFHGILPKPDSRARSALLSAIERHLVRRADATTTVSVDTFNQLSKPGALVIENGVDVPENPQSRRESTRRRLGLTDEIVVLYSGRLARLKGVDILVRAFGRAMGMTRNPLRLLIIGGGDPTEVAKFRDLVDGAPLREKVIRIDANEDYRGTISAADLYLFPSFREGLPITLLEAMAVGLPVVVSRTGGIPEVVRDGVEGFLVAPGDVDGFARAIAHLANHPAQRESMGAHARHRVAEAYAQAVMVKKYVELYERTADSLSSQSVELHGLPGDRVP